MHEFERLGVDGLVLRRAEQFGVLVGHEPAQTLVDGELAYRGTLVGRYTELQELVALVDRGDVELRTSHYDPEDINTVAERLEHGEIDWRAVIRP